MLVVIRWQICSTLLLDVNQLRSRLVIDWRLVLSATWPPWWWGSWAIPLVLHVESLRFQGTWPILGLIGWGLFEMLKEHWLLLLSRALGTYHGFWLEMHSWLQKCLSRGGNRSWKLGALKVLLLASCTLYGALWVRCKSYLLAKEDLIHRTLIGVDTSSSCVC